MIANCHAKSVLRAVCGIVYEEFPNVDYFPSYESVTLSKTPHVWKDDLRHVQEDFVAKIVEHMVKHYVHGELSMEALHESEKPAANDVVLLSGGRPATPGIHIREPNGETFVVVASARAKTSRIEFGPLDLKGYDMFSTVLKMREEGAPDLRVALEILEAGSGKVCFTDSVNVVGVEPTRWRVSLPPLPGKPIVAMSFTPIGDRADAPKFRVRVNKPRFVRPGVSRIQAASR
jgi:hypothetical protein